MKAAVLHQFSMPLVIETCPDPTPAAGELVVDIHAVPVLPYSDEVFANSRPHGLQLPIVPGCGAVGRIRSIGTDATRLKVGDWVYCDPTFRARDDAETPETILQGWAAPSVGAQVLQKHFHHGAFATQMLMPMECASRVAVNPDDDPTRWCALGSFLVPYGGLLASGLRPGQTALISGATGHFGSAAVAVALAMGAVTVVAPGRNTAMLSDLSARFGRRIRTVRLTGNEGEDCRNMAAAAGPIDCVLDILPPLADASPIRAAAMAVRPGGTVVLMGGSGVSLDLPYRHLMRNNITIRGQWMYPRHAVPNMIRLAEGGILPLDQFAFDAFRLDDANEAVACARQNAGPFRMTVIQPT